jgi:hypothetical protein
MGEVPKTEVKATVSNVTVIKSAAKSEDSVESEGKDKIQMLMDKFDEILQTKYLSKVKKKDLA